MMTSGVGEAVSYSSRDTQPTLLDCNSNKLINEWYPFFVSECPHTLEAANNLPKIMIKVKRCLQAKFRPLCS